MVSASARTSTRTLDGLSVLRHEQINERHSEEQTQRAGPRWLMQISVPTEKLITPNRLPIKLSDIVTCEVEGHELKQINVRCIAGTQTLWLP